MLLRTRIDASHHPGDIVYVDIRNRALFEHEGYNSFDVEEEKDIRHRYVRLRVGKSCECQVQRRSQELSLSTRRLFLCTARARIFYTTTDRCTSSSVCPRTVRSSRGSSQQLIRMCRSTSTSIA